ncbi:MAG: hypothetical protein GX881_00220, partial [Firmicutes bacterium]|nr:hypothetical protein [Bacillota bacterium]
MEAEKQRSQTNIARVELEGGIQRIGVLSDTHIPARARCLPPELFRRLQ